MHYRVRPCIVIILCAFAFCNFLFAQGVPKKGSATEKVAQSAKTNSFSLPARYFLFEEEEWEYCNIPEGAVLTSGDANIQFNRATKYIRLPRLDKDFQLDLRINNKIVKSFITRISRQESVKLVVANSHLIAGESMNLKIEVSSNLLFYKSAITLLKKTREGVEYSQVEKDKLLYDTPVSLEDNQAEYKVRIEMDDGTVYFSNHVKISVADKVNVIVCNTNPEVSLVENVSTTKLQPLTFFNKLALSLEDKKSTIHSAGLDNDGALLIRSRADTTKRFVFPKVDPQLISRNWLKLDLEALKDWDDADCDLILNTESRKQIFQFRLENPRLEAVLKINKPGNDTLKPINNCFEQGKYSEITDKDNLVLFFTYGSDTVTFEKAKFGNFIITSAYDTIQRGSVDEGIRRLTFPMCDYKKYDNGDLLTIEVRFGGEKLIKQVRLYKLYDYYGWSGFWLPTVLTAVHLKADESNHRVVSVFPVSVAWGMRFYLRRNKHYIGASLLAEWITISDDKSKYLSSGSLGAFFDFNNYCYVGFGYKFEIQKKPMPALIVDVSLTKILEHLVIP